MVYLLGSYVLGLYRVSSCVLGVLDALWVFFVAASCVWCESLLR